MWQLDKRHITLFGMKGQELSPEDIASYYFEGNDRVRRNCAGKAKTPVTSRAAWRCKEDSTAGRTKTWHRFQDAIGRKAAWASRCQPLPRVQIGTGKKPQPDPACRMTNRKLCNYDSHAAFKTGKGFGSQAAFASLPADNRYEIATSNSVGPT